MSARFRFFKNRNLSQSILRFPEGFALGNSETSTDTAVGARQQSSAARKIRSSIVLEPASPVDWVHFRKRRLRWIIFLEQEWVTSGKRVKVLPDARKHGEIATPIRYASVRTGNTASLPELPCLDTRTVNVLGLAIAPNFLMASKTALTSADGAIQMVRYASTMGSRGRNRNGHR